MATKSDAATRVQALTLLQKGVSMEEIMKDTGYARSSIYAIQKTAKARGYDPSKDTRILLSYVEDAPRTGRPKKCTPQVEEKVIKAISQISITHELSTQKIADTLSPLVQAGSLLEASTASSIPKATNPVSQHENLALRGQTSLS